MIYPSLLSLGMVLLAAPPEPTRSFSQVELDGDEAIARVFVDALELSEAWFESFDFDGSDSIEYDELNEVLDDIARYFERSFVIKRGYRPCESWVQSVEPVGNLIRAEMFFRCASDGFVMIEARFAHALADAHVHQMEVSRADGRARTYDLLAPYRKALGPTSLPLAIWAYLRAGVRGVFAGPAVLAFFVLVSLTGAMASPNRDVRFPVMTAGFLVAGVLRPFYWPDAAPAQDLLALFPIAALAFYWYAEPLRAGMLAPWIAPWLGATAGAEWLRYGWPGDFGFFAWFFLAFGALGCWLAMAFATSLLAEGALDRRRSHQRTFILGAVSVFLAAAHVLAGGAYVVVLLVPYLATAGWSLSGRIPTSLLPRRSVFILVVSLVIVLLIRPT